MKLGRLKNYDFHKMWYLMGRPTLMQKSGYREATDMRLPPSDSVYFRGIWEKYAEPKSTQGF